MPYDNDEQRRAARARLKARMERRGGSLDQPSSGARPRMDARPSSRTAGSSNPVPAGTERPRRGSRNPYRGTSRSSRTQASGTGITGGIGNVLEGIGGKLGDALDRLPLPRRTVALIAAGIVVLIIIAFGVSRCAAPAQPDSPGDVNAAASANSSSDGSADAAGSDESQSAVEPDDSTSSSSANADDSTSSSPASAGLDDPEQTLAELIGWDETDKLMDQARTNPEALWIAAHADVFAKETVGVQAKILKLAADEPKAVTYVRSYPDEYPLEKSVDDSSIAMESGSPSAEVPNTDVPHFYQWDRRWGNTVYSSTAFALTGCGPTSYAMVYQGVTGKDDMDPFDMSELAQKRGYMSQHNGTDASMFVYTADELGMVCEKVYSSKDSMINALKAKKVVLARLGAGIFTNRGHFIVLTGLTDDGQVIINDPYSWERSSVTWDPDVLVHEANTFFIFSAK